MNLLILTRFPTEYEPQRLSKEAQKKGVKTQVISYEKISLFWQKEKVKINLPGDLRLNDFDLVIPRSSAHQTRKSQIILKTSIIKSLSAEITCLNQKTFASWPILGKIYQGVLLAQKGIPVIPSWFFPEATKKETFLKNATYPLICKGQFGSHSKKTFRVDSQSQAQKILKNVEGEFFFQPLIKSPFYYRVIVLDNKVIGIMKRKTNPRFLSSNLKKGFNTQVNVTDLKKLSIKVSSILRADLAGVDILIDQSQKPLVIEVNRSPQFKVFEKKLKINVAGKIIKYLIKKSPDKYHN